MESLAPAAAPGHRAKLRSFLNISHRGASGHAPENTTAAYDLAASMGAHYIELDVQTSKDGNLVVVHDLTVDRTARRGPDRVSGHIHSHTLAELKTLDVGSWFNDTFAKHRRDEYAGLQILSLEEVFDRYRQYIRFCIELKQPLNSPGVERKLLRLLERCDLDVPKGDDWRVLVMSLDAACLKMTAALHPGLPLTKLFTKRHTSESIEVQLGEVRRYARSIGAPQRAVDAELIAAAHARGLSIYPYTVNEPERMAQLITMGVDGLITNFPDRVDAVMLSLRARMSPAL